MIYYADDFMLDSTGATDISNDFTHIIRDVMVSGDVFEFRQNGKYLFNDNCAMYYLVGLTIKGNNATLFATTERDFGFFHLLGCSELKFYDLNLIGYSFLDYTGDLTTTGVGTPTIVGTTKQLDALNESVYAPDDVDNGRAYGRDKDGYCRLAVTLSDTAHVANDCQIVVKNRDGMVLETITIPLLTSTPTEYQLAHRLVNIYDILRWEIKKATGTANTITVTRVKEYNTNAFRSSLEYASGWSVASTSGLHLINVRVEGVGGDSFQDSSLGSGLVIKNMLSRCCARQGISFSFSVHSLVEDTNILFSGRSGIDIEPYTQQWYCEDLLFKRIEIYRPGINGVSSTNWARITRIAWEDLTVVDCEAIAFNGGGNTFTIKNFRHIKIVDPNTSGGGGTIVPDFHLSGQSITAENICVDRGIAISAVPDADKNGVYRYPGGITIDGYKIARGSLGVGLTIPPGVPGVTILNGPGDNYNAYPEPDENGSFAGVGPVAGNVRHGSGLLFGIHNHRWPNSYKGFFHSSVHMPGGFDLLDESLHRVGGLGGSNATVTLQALTARTATGTTTGVDVGEVTAVKLRLYISAITGTTTDLGQIAPSLDVAIQQSHDNSLWTTIDSFRTVRQTFTSGWAETIEIRNTARYLRLSYVITGNSPSFTFEVAGTSTVASNNFRGLNAAVTASATTHAVTFPAKTMPNPNSFTLTGATYPIGGYDVVAGTLTPSTTYYYRLGSRRIRGGPVVPLTELNVTLGAAGNGVDIRVFGTDQVASGYAVPALTIWRGTSAGTYTRRLDVMPIGRLASMSASATNNQVVTDLGNIAYFWQLLGASGAVQNGGFPVYMPWRTGSFTPADETGWELDTTYDVWVTTNWNSGFPYITAKARTGFTINFPNAAPGDGSGRVSWELIR